MNKVIAIFFVTFLLYACKNKSVISTGDEVQIIFVIKTKSGKRIDSSVLPNCTLPIRIIAGKKMLLKDLDDAIIGMKQGDKKTIQLLPKNAYPKGISYVDENNSNKFLIEPNDTLLADIEIAKIEN